MKTSYLFLAEGFEEIEALTVVDMLRRAGMPVKTVSITSQKEVKGAHAIPVTADMLYEPLNLTDTDWLILPGGLPGATHLGEFAPLQQLLTNHAAQNGNIAAICAAPSVLGDLGLLNGRKATCYPGFESRLTGADYTARTVEIADNIITGKGPGMAAAFALAIIDRSAGTEKAQEVAGGMLLTE
ncbi:MAG: DJ-1/PfpI family protein [Coprobacter sp.]|nr:DJ-1/PfpI family protein [Coprobacter sp.]